MMKTKNSAIEPPARILYYHASRLGPERGSYVIVRREQGVGTVVLREDRQGEHRRSSYTPFRYI